MRNFPLTKLMSLFIFIILSSCLNEDSQILSDCEITDIQLIENYGEHGFHDNKYEFRRDDQGRVTRGFHWDTEIVDILYGNNTIEAIGSYPGGGSVATYTLNARNLIVKSDSDIKVPGISFELHYIYNSDNVLIRVENRKKGYIVNLQYENDNLIGYETSIDQSSYGSRKTFIYDSNEEYIKSYVVEPNPIFNLPGVESYLLNGGAILYDQGYFGKIPKNRIIQIIEKNPENIYEDFYMNFDYQFNNNRLIEIKITGDEFSDNQYMKYIFHQNCE